MVSDLCFVNTDIDKIKEASRKIVCMNGFGFEHSSGT